MHTGAMNVAEDGRRARRKVQSNATCRLDSRPVTYPVFELSAHGFSFLCPRDACPFQRAIVFGKITISNAEGVEIIIASGTVVHVTEFDFLHHRIGVFYTKKALDRTITGKVRIPRHIPKVRIGAMIGTGCDGQEVEYAGQVMDFTVTTARIAFTDSPPLLLQVGDEVRIRIQTDAVRLLEGQANILRKRSDGGEVIVRFADQLLDVSRVDTVSNALQNRQAIACAFEPLRAYKSISPEFKALICDWRMYTARLKRVLDLEDNKRIYRTSADQEHFLQGIEDGIFADLRDFIQRLNEQVDHLGKKESTAYKEYFRENVGSFVRMAPLGASIIDKENGYAGDFETIKQFFENPYSGDTLFAKLMNKFLCGLEPVMAHRDRIRFLYQELCSGYHRSADEFTFLSLGSGPAEEVLRFVGKNSFDRPVQATLLDMDAFALADFSERLQYLQKQNFMVDLININILSILRGKEPDPIKRRFAYLYCAGLFDYFNDGICRRLVRFLIDHAEPGGVACFTNVHRSNVARHVMDYAGGWEVVHRDEQEVRDLVPPGYRSEVLHDGTYTNLYFKVYVT